MAMTIPGHSTGAREIGRMPPNRVHEGHLHIIDGGIRRRVPHLIAAPSKNGDSKWPILQDWTFP